MVRDLRWELWICGCKGEEGGIPQSDNILGLCSSSFLSIIYFLFAYDDKANWCDRLSFAIDHNHILH